MADPNIADAATSMFGNDKAHGHNTVFTYSENTLTHDGTVAPRGHQGLGIDCSELANQAQLAAGYNVPYRATWQIYENGHLTPDGAKHYDTVATNDLQKGDLILFKTHIGVVESFDPKTGKGQFFGSQDSTGPARADFDVNGGTYWGGDREHVLTGLKPKAETYNPKAAAEALQPIFEKREQALASLPKESPVVADAQKIITNNKQVLENLEAGKPGPAKGQEPTGDQPSSTSQNQAPAAPSRLDDPAHPANGLYTQIHGKLADLDAQYGRTSDQRTSNLAGSLTVAAKEQGLTRVDAVQPNDNGSRMYAQQQIVPRAVAETASVDTVKGMSAPLEQSSAAWLKAQPQQQNTLAQNQVQAQTQAQNQTQTQTQAAQQQGQPPMQIQIKPPGQ